MNELIMVIKDIGFPVFVAVFCLVKLDKRLLGIHEELKKINDKGGD